MHVEDHPLEYGSFEGIIPPKQYRLGHRHAVGQRDVAAEGGARGGLPEGSAQVRAEGREAARRVDAGAHARRPLPRRSGPGCSSRRTTNTPAPPRRAPSSRTSPTASPPGAASRKSRKAPTASGIRTVGGAERARWCDRSSRDPAEKRSPPRDPRGARGGAPSAARRASAFSRREGARYRAALSAIERAVEGALPAFVEPELATLVKETPAGPEWLHEMKLDGYRILARMEGGKVRLYTRNRNDWTDKFPSIAEAVAALPVRSAWLDGEIVVMKASGLSSFQALQNALSREDTGSLHYYVFDLPFLDGRDLRKAPLVERKSLLEKVLSGAPPAAALFSSHVPGSGDGVLRKGLQARAGRHRVQAGGLALPRRPRPRLAQDQVRPAPGDGDRRLYRSRRARAADWARCSSASTSPMAGCAIPEKSARASTMRRSTACAGSSTRSRATTPPFSNPPRGAEARRAHWVKSPARRGDRLHRMDRRRHAAPPVLPGIAGGQEPERSRARTAGRRSDEPRAASCEPQAASRKRQATSRDPQGTRQGSGVRSQRGTRSRATSHGSRVTSHESHSSVVAGITLTHPDKVLYPEAGITKRDLALYYEAVADRILPHLAESSADARALPERLEQAVLLSEARHGGRPESHRARRGAGRRRQGDLHDGEFAPRSRRARCRWACWSSIRGAPARRSSAIPTASSSTSIRTTTCRGARSPMRRAS